MELDISTKAYLAGIIDGESYIGIEKNKPSDCHHPSYVAVITVEMTNENTIKFLAETFKGKYRRRQIRTNTPNRKPIYVWKAAAAAAEKVLKIILPFLRVKKASAENVLALRKLQADGKAHLIKITSTRRKAYSNEYVACLEEKYLRAKELNHMDCSQITVTNMLPTKLDTATKAYIAGLIDGEGWIGISKGKNSDCYHYTYKAILNVTMTNRSIVEFLVGLFGGHYRCTKNNNPNHSTIYIWRVQDATAEKVLNIMLPFFQIKKPSAELVLSFREIKANGSVHRTKIVGTRTITNPYGSSKIINTMAYSDEYVACLESIYLKAKELNH